MNNKNEHPDWRSGAVECTASYTGEIRWIPITKDLTGIRETWLDTLLQQIHENPTRYPIWIAETCARTLKKSRV